MSPTVAELLDTKSLVSLYREIQVELFKRASANSDQDAVFALMDYEGSPTNYRVLLATLSASLSALIDYEIHAVESKGIVDYSGPIPIPCLIFNENVDVENVVFSDKGRVEVDLIGLEAIGTSLVNVDAVSEATRYEV